MEDLEVSARASKKLDNAELVEMNCEELGEQPMDSEMQKLVRGFLEQWESSCRSDARNELRSNLLRLLEAGQACAEYANGTLNANWYKALAAIKENLHG